MTVTNKHPVIIHSLERKIIGERMLHTLLLTDPDFYEDLAFYDWAGPEFASGIAEGADASLPDEAGLWTAEFRIDGDSEFQAYQLVQESPWRQLTDEEAIRFAQGLPIEEVIAVENRQLELNFPTEEAKEQTDE